MFYINHVSRFEFSVCFSTQYHLIGENYVTMRYQLWRNYCDCVALEKYYHAITGSLNEGICSLCIENTKCHIAKSICRQLGICLAASVDTASQLLLSLQRSSWFDLSTVEGRKTKQTKRSAFLRPRNDADQPIKRSVRRSVTRSVSLCKWTCYPSQRQWTTPQPRPILVDSICVHLNGTLNLPAWSSHRFCAKYSKHLLLKRVKTV